jgi:hypothetical protein
VSPGSETCARVVMASALAVVCGCNAVLGIERGKPREEAGGPAAPVLQCAWMLPSHRKLADLSAKTSSRTFTDAIFVAPYQGGGALRIFVWYPARDAPLEVYSFNVTAGGAVAPQTLGSPGEYPLAVQLEDETASGVGVLTDVLTLARPEGSSEPSVGLYRFRDSDQVNVAARQVVARPGLLGNPVFARVLAPTLDQAFVAMTLADATTYRLALGHAEGSAVGDPIEIAKSTAAPDMAARALLRVGTKSYLFAGVPGGAAGPSLHAIEDTAGAPLASRSLGPPGTFVLNAAESGDKLNVGWVDTRKGVDIYSGQVSVSDLDTFELAQLPLVTTSAGLADVPFTTVPMWFGDELITVGPTGAGSSDLSIAWTDALGRLRARQVLGHAQTDGKIRAAGFSVRELFSLGGTFDVAWIESRPDADSGQPYDVILYDQVRCL